ncbi:RING-H2 finger protein ATL80-like [Nymphaea colorata]|uniref:RING-H2 finger protein ATL80-like n=1 Tax=Nymphaea colorata TaxID=210225 RepID=UPI00129D78BD|nr:RING-H2 finger protein ATL80-like [Nymphaea colorata]
MNLSVLVLCFVIRISRAHNLSGEADQSDGLVIFASLPLIALVVFLAFLFCKLQQINDVRRNSGVNEVIRVHVIHSGASLTSAGVGGELISFLPVFPFSSLSCSSGGLAECAICLAKFEDTDALHLLPKCRHAFHAECIRQWLANHSSYPVCRQIVVVEDFTSITCLNGLLNPGRMEETIQIDMKGECVHQEIETRQDQVKDTEGCSNSSDGRNAYKDDP